MTATGVVPADRGAGYLTAACAVDDLTRRGFTEDFRVGVYSDPVLSALLEHVPIRQTA